MTYKQEYKLRFCKVCYKRQIPVKDWYIGTIKWQDKDMPIDEQSKR